MKNQFVKLRRGRQGAALIVVLVIMSLMMAMTLAFLTSAKLELKTAGSFEHTQVSKMLAQSAVSHGVEILRSNIPDPARLEESSDSAPGELWITNPGRLTVLRDGGQPEYIDLHTGAVSQDPANEPYPDAISVDLNRPLAGSTYPPICISEDANGNPELDGDKPVIPEMRVLWKNVLEDPSKTASEDNPLIGRYAFWMDDESGKLNYNTAAGKPAIGKVDASRFHEQLNAGHPLPTFNLGSAALRFNTKKDNVTQLEFNPNAVGSSWSLGNPRAINLDVLTEQETDLDIDALMENTWLHGFSKYPEAIQDYLTVADPVAWYQEKKYNLTFYSRSPEFNAFGRSRYFLTHQPVSLEGGPTYQTPFIYNPGSTADEGVTHLNTLYGGSGWDVWHRRTNPGARVKNARAFTAIHKAEIETLVEYMRRPWPGYGASFFDKYGEKECYQIALNIVQMGKSGSVGGGDSGRRSSMHNYTAVNHISNRGTNPDLAGWRLPERHFWKFNAFGDESGEDEPLTAQGVGPHLTDIKFTFKLEAVKQAKKDDEGNPVLDVDGNPEYEKVPNKYWLNFKHQSEFYMPSFGGIANLSVMPVLVDYLKVETNTQGDSPLELGVGDNFKNHHAILKQKIGNWQHPLGLSRLAARPADVIRKSWIGSEELATQPKGGRGRANQFGDGALRNRPPELRPLRSLSSRFAALPKNPEQFRNRRRARLYQFPGRALDHKIRHAKQYHIPEDSSITIDFAVRLGVSRGRHAGDGDDEDDAREWDLPVVLQGGVLQMIPLGETHEDEDVLKGTVTIDVGFGENQNEVSFYIEDPRLNQDKDNWKDGDKFGEVNWDESNPNIDLSKFRYLNIGTGFYKPTTGSPFLAVKRAGSAFASYSRLGNPGHWSFLHTGIQNNIQWKSLSLGPSGSDDQDGPGGASPPDYLLLDLFGANFPMQNAQWEIDKTLPDQFSTISYMNSTAGQVNLNTKVYPNGNDWFKAPQRRKPLEGVFRYLMDDSLAGDQAKVKELVDNIHEYQDNDPFLYVGELAEVDGYTPSGASNQFEREALLRNTYGCLTTRSNTFGLWGVSQMVTKKRVAANWGQFEEGDAVRSERRFYALIERYIWTGRDGVPGNGYVNENGEMDRLATKFKEEWFESGSNTNNDDTLNSLFGLPGSPPFLVHRGNKGGRGLRLRAKGRYPQFDGPEPVGMDASSSVSMGSIDYEPSTLEEAYNPPQPVVKYRVVYFKYLDS